MSHILATMTERLSEGARGVSDPQCGRPNRNYSPGDDSPSGPQASKRDRTREGIPSPQQKAQGEDHDTASLSLGAPSVPLDFLGQEPAAAQANTTQPRLDPGPDLFKTTSQYQATLTHLAPSTLAHRSYRTKHKGGPTPTMKSPTTHQAKSGLHVTMRHKLLHLTLITMPLPL